MASIYLREEVELLISMTNVDMLRAVHIASGIPQPDVIATFPQAESCQTEYRWVLNTIVYSVQKCQKLIYLATNIISKPEGTMSSIGMNKFDLKIKNFFGLASHASGPGYESQPSKNTSKYKHKKAHV